MPFCTTIILAPAAELLVEVKGRGAITRLHITQPFGNDIEKRGIESDGSTYKRDDNPTLSGVVGFPQSVSPRSLAMPIAAGRLLALRIPSYPFLGCILDPVYRRGLVGDQKNRRGSSDNVKYL